MCLALDSCLLDGKCLHSIPKLSYHTRASPFQGWNGALVLGCTTLAVIFYLVSSLVFSVRKGNFLFSFYNTTSLICGGNFRDIGNY